jgi:hypothetical protein
MALSRLGKPGRVPRGQLARDQEGAARRVEQGRFVRRAMDLLCLMH